MSRQILEVECKARDCHKTFPAPIQLLPEVFQEANLGEGLYECPHCENESVYVKSDHRFRWAGDL